jgi:hypothetical protein
MLVVESATEILSLITSVPQIDVRSHEVLTANCRVMYIRLPAVAFVGLMLPKWHCPLKRVFKQFKNHKTVSSTNQLLNPSKTSLLITVNIRYSDQLCAGRPRVGGSSSGKKFSLLHIVQTNSEATQFPIQLVPGAFSSGVNRPRREADHSPPTGKN